MKNVPKMAKKNSEMFSNVVDVTFFKRNVYNSKNVHENSANLLLSEKMSENRRYFFEIYNSILQNSHIT